MRRSRLGPHMTAPPPTVTTGTRAAVRLFGALEVRSADGHAIEAGPPMQRALLALLALHAGRVVPTDELIDGLWGERAPRTAAHSVQIYVSDLRRALAAADRLTIDTVRPGYRLNAPDGAIDLLEFERLAVGEDEASLESALAMWSAAPLDEFRYEQWVRPHVDRLVALRADAAERLSALVLLTDPHAALQWALTAIDADPYREGACELAMRARYRLGRHADALRAYDEYRRRLSDDLGLTPSPALQAVHQAVLRHDSALGEAVPVGSPPMPRRPGRRAAAAAVAVTALATAAIVALIVVVSAPAAPPVRDAILLRNLPGIQISLQFDRGFSDAIDELGYRGRSIDATVSETAVADALEEVPDVVVMAAIDIDPAAVAAAHPDIHFLTFDTLVEAPNTTSVLVNTHEASYLAGAAAALTSESGTVGFIGGVDEELIWEFAAGFAAGATAVDPDVRVLTRYLAEPPNWGDGFEEPPAGHAAARELYGQGADVIFAAAGTSGLGVLQAAVDVTAGTGAFHWVIGVDTDEYETIMQRPLSVDPIPLQRHVLTSVLKHSDVVMKDALIAYDRGESVPGVRNVGLAEGAVDISYSGGFLDAVRPTLEALRRSILDGEITVPCRPADRVGRSTPERPHPCPGP